VLIVLSGLPGTGKTTVARELARARGAVHLRIDSIEQALRTAGVHVQGEGYAAAYAVAEDNLRLGRTVVADCVNPWPRTRREWHAVAERAGVPSIDVELVCSDREEHRRRVETRTADIAAHELPSWQQVLDRDYQPWTSDRIILDTARRSVQECVEDLSARLRARQHS
jgi:predicted kinase